MKRMLLLFCLTVFSSCFFGHIENFKTAKYDCQDGKRTAILFSKIPAYTELNSVHISILKKDQKLKNSAKGNIFQCEFPDEKKEYHGTTVFWVSKDSLLIMYDNGVAVKKQKNRFKGKTIVYKTFPD